MIKIQLLTLSGAFKFAEKKEVKTEAEALAAAKAYAEPQGYTRIKIVDDHADCCSFRITGTAPNGRAGRNIASCDVWDDEARDLAGDS